MVAVLLTQRADSENAKGMMPQYHIGSLDEKSLARLSDAEPQVEPAGERPLFLQSKVWSKALLSEKRAISADTKIFTFKLDHEAQVVGLPIGQHLMMRLRDPVTREAIIRAYTPISEGTDKGRLHVLVKIYYDTAERKGGKMTQALDSIPVGHFVDFKGPVGKFEYLGKGRCAISGKQRLIRRLIMICGGSGITPIFQVLRAVMKDRDDATRCLVLDGNRSEEDILCKGELDAMAALNADKCTLLYTLSRPAAHWQGLRGRMDQELFESRIGGPPEARDSLVLICGPESLEKSAHQILHKLGWADEDLLFF
jgi:nitrate reductase (NAD(P)H)